MTTAEDAASTLVGRLLDERYRLDRVIARGGMATVYVATDTRLDRTVAVKVMHRALADDPEFVARFTREARAAARVSAPEVVAVHDQGTDGDTGLAYLVMEHVQGMNLRQLLQQGPLSPSRAVSLMEPVLRALAAAHAAGLVHRDVKPENVLLADDGRVKVADFGLARAVETSNLTQTTGLLIGTVAYLAPEQVESGSADARSDVYAAGVLLWELLVGTPPYDGEKPLSVAYRHVHEDVPPPSTQAGGIPPALDDLVVRATRRDPEQRPPDGGAFLAELVSVKATLPAVELPVTQHQTLVVPRRVSGAPEKPDKPRRSRRAWWWWSALLALALFALGGGYYVGSYRYTNAPSVLKETLAAATKTLEDAGLHVKRGPDRFDETVLKGLVVAQDPGPNGRVRKEGTVTVFLSKGPDRRTVPSVAGKDQRAARAALEAVGLVVAEKVRQAYSQTVAKDLVATTDPKPGEKLRPGTSVTLVVSKGKEPVEVPNVTGKQRADAEAQLKALGFDVDVKEAFSDDIAVGIVMDQSPSSGTADKGSTVSLTVSKGPDLVAIPDLRGQTYEQAKGVLEGLGLKVRKRSFPGGPGEVLRTDPERGQKVRRGTTVTVYVF